MHIDDFIEDKAKKGDGLFAIAYALLQVSEAGAFAARELRRLGNAEATTPFGALEALGMQIEKAAQIIADAWPTVED